MTSRVFRKRRMKYLRIMYAAIALFSGVLSPARSFAQSDSSNQNVQELRRQLDELRQQLNQLQARLGELEGTKGTEAANAPAAPSAKQEGTIQSTQPPAQASPSKQIGQATATYTTFSEDNVAAARFDNIPLDPKYKGFFHLPGTRSEERRVGKGGRCRRWPCE